MIMLFINLLFSYLYDSDFVVVIYEFRNGFVYFDFERLFNLFINFLSFDFEWFLICLDDLDFDIYFNIDGGCFYYVEDKFNDIF